MKYFAIICILLLAGCGTPTGQVTQEPIKIGAILHLSNNDYARVGQAMKEGIDLAVAEQNAKGGINGTPIKVIYEDTQYNNIKANTAGQKLIQVDNVDAALISTYTEVLSVGPLFEQEQTPLVVLWDSSEQIDDIGEYVFGTGSWTESSGTRIAEYAYNDLELRKISIINNNAEWSNAIADYFAKRFVELGGTIVSQESLPESESDFRTVLTKAQSKKPDAIFAPLSNHLDAFFKQKEQLRFKGEILSANALTQQTIDVSDGAAEGVYYTTLTIPSNPQTQMLKAKYEQTYMKETDQLLFVGLGYDGALSIIHAMQNGHSREDVKNGLYATKDLEGAFGNITFNSGGSAPRYESVFQVRDGKETFISD